MLDNIYGRHKEKILIKQMNTNEIDYKPHKTSGMVIAAFLGTVVAGGALMVVNNKRLGHATLA
ncbi:hypothetical protein [Parachitinimonas caeni]|uniref:Uncharacterized protein n=1 Tax=Parachitinimonas caeni TaxID=3031301 RepID=A0ABT7E0M6_9NEIS|nr:hypothetical protein [Parachitinimonas caeni]MDK2125831.1 hypothetical protein [Parachitinimonas caeni]